MTNDSTGAAVSDMTRLNCLVARLIQDAIFHSANRAVDIAL